MTATKINITKLMRTTNINLVRSHSYKTFYTHKFIIRKLNFQIYGKYNLLAWKRRL